MNNDKTLNMKEAANLLGVTRDTMRSWIKKGKINIPYARPNHSYIFRESDLKSIFQKIQHNEIPSKEGK